MKPWENDTIALNGKPVSENFHEWFRGSCAIDENGIPLLLYHGTELEFTEFKLSPTGTLGGGIYLTNDYGLAQGFANGKAPMALYANVKNPYVIDLNLVTDYEARLDLRSPFRKKGSRERLIEQGYDGVILREGSFIEVVAYHPEQIKSATSNTGLYLKGSPCIDDAEPARLLASAALAKTQAQRDVLRCTP